MQQSLNSIILEGIVSSNPKPIAGSAACLFDITSVERIGGNSNKKIREHSFSVKISERLSQINRLSSGRELRIVGRLKSNYSEDQKSIPAVYIYAEHIDVKPGKKRRKEG